MTDHPRQELAPGLTYRQLDYWTRLGLLYPDNGPTPGSGHSRQWSDTELAVARRIGQYRLQGLELAAAARRARDETPPATIPCGLGWPA
jgi:DNA-binding transcriptional MerR regulator